MLFIVIACIVFLFFSKHYFVARKRDSYRGNDKESVIAFSIFMVVCTVLWLAIKYALKSSVFILICILFWPEIKKLFEGNKEYDAAK